ncbi:MAG: patatin-like phospholipase family protein [Gammaproteobacteria bacterium]
MQQVRQPAAESALQNLALVVSGGGARAAYQAGVLRWLAQRYPWLRFPILTGVSAGALNAVYLASHAGSLPEQVEDLAKVWSGLTLDQIFRVDLGSIGSHVLGWGARLVMGRASSVVKTRSLVDNAPLERLLERTFHTRDGYLYGISENLARGSLKAVAITASSYSTGQSITWVQGRDVHGWRRAHRKGQIADLTLAHVLASASLPFFFPAVFIGGCWFGDGGIRLTAPLSPALHLGADRILVISTRYAPSGMEWDCPLDNAYPPPVAVAGALYDAIFFDMLENDALRLKRINTLVSALPEEGRSGLRDIALLQLRPSIDLGQLATEHEVSLPGALRFMTRGLGTHQTRHNDLLSVMLFEPGYTGRLLALGYTDAAARSDEIDAFLTAPSVSGS